MVGGSIYVVSLVEGAGDLRHLATAAGIALKARNSDVFQSGRGLGSGAGEIFEFLQPGPLYCFASFGLFR